MNVETLTAVLALTFSFDACSDGDESSTESDGTGSTANEGSTSQAEATPWAESSPITPDVQETYLGTYRVTDYLRSEDDCGPGKSVFSEFGDEFMQAHLSGYEENFLAFGSCTTIESCQMVTSQMSDPEGASFLYIYRTAVNENYLRGTSANSSRPVGGVCEGRVHDNFILKRHGDGTLTLRLEQYDLPPEPTEDGQCYIEAARFEEEARDEPCTGLFQIELEPVD